MRKATGTGMAAITILCTLFWGCASKNLLTKSDKIDKIPTPTVTVKNTRGSLWRSPTGENLFSDHRIWKVGDILTVIISESSKASKSASTKTSRESGINGGVTALMSPTFLSKALGSDPGNLIGANYSNSQIGIGSTGRNETLEGKIGVVVKKIMSGGNLYVEGKREITVNEETQIMKISGLVRQCDIKRENTISSSYLANASITYSGKGSVSDRQYVGWISRLWDWLRIL